MPVVTPPASALSHLNEAADQILADAVSSRSARIYAASGGARENISIVHQQGRCVNLAWALKHRKRVNPGDVVAIVGGSFSGMMLAASLAMTADVIVYLFEKEGRLLPRFRDKGHRYLSPVLNSRDLGPGFNPLWSPPAEPRPIFAWSRDIASGMAAQWLAEWARYADKLPIFSFFNTEVRSSHITEVRGRLEIRTATAEAPHLLPLSVDLLLDATGFGEERNDLDLVDFSYWASGHRLIYEHLSRPAKVMISGCGDSGLIEALHYAISDFRHEWIDAFWRGQEAAIDEGLKRARLDDVLKDGEVFGLDVISEVGWWLQMHHRIEMHRGDQGLWLEPHHKPFFDAIEAVLSPLLKAWRGCKSGAISWAERQEFCEALSQADQARVREALGDLTEIWSSLKIKALAESLDPGDLVDTLRNERRTGLEIVLNGLTPTPYTRSLSPHNVWVMRLLMELPGVRYLQGRIQRVVDRPDRAFDVLLEGGVSERVDRIVSRYGARGGAGLAFTSPSLKSAGAAMLVAPFFQTAHSTKANVVQGHYPAFQTVRDAAQNLRTSASPNGARDLSKKAYVSRMLQGQRSVPPDDDLFADPQARLADDLRQGRRSTFFQDDAVEVAFAI